jgi:hypothetical protein
MGLSLSARWNHAALRLLLGFVREGRTVIADAAVGPTYVAALLLVFSGVGKLRNPKPAAQALFTARWPHSSALVRTVGLAEITAPLLLLTLGAIGATAIAVIYAGFFAFIASVLLRNLDLTSCGCTGAAETPPTWLHAVLNAIASVAAATGAAAGIPAVSVSLSELGAMAPTSLLGVLASAWLAYLVVTNGPRLFLSSDSSPTAKEA